MKISDDLLSDGQKELEELTKSSSVDRVKLMSANAKITASLKRKRELQTEKDELTAKITSSWADLCQLPFETFVFAGTHLVVKITDVVRLLILAKSWKEKMKR